MDVRLGLIERDDCFTCEPRETIQSAFEATRVCLDVSQF